MLTLKRHTEFIIPGSPATRVCSLHWDGRETLVDTPDAHLWEASEKVWSAIENADDPDKIPTDCTELIMARMNTSKRPALWVKDTKLFVHSLGWGDDVLHPTHDSAKHGNAHMLKGCTMPCGGLYRDKAKFPDHAMAEIFEALGGFEEGKRVPFRCVETGVLPEVQYELVEIVPPNQVEEHNGCLLCEAGYRLTGLDDGSVIVERRKK